MYMTCKWAWHIVLLVYVDVGCDFGSDLGGTSCLSCFNLSRRGCRVLMIVLELMTAWGSVEHGAASCIIIKPSG